MLQVNISHNSKFLCRPLNEKRPQHSVEVAGAVFIRVRAGALVPRNAYSILFSRSLVAYFIQCVSFSDNRRAQDTQLCELPPND